MSSWNATGVTNCLITATDTDDPGNDPCAWITEVHEDQINSRASSLFGDPCPYWDLSVPALHAEIAREGYEVFWADNGVPTRIRTQTFDSVDEGIEVTVEFQDLTGAPSVRSELAAARQRWAAAAISNYRLELREGRNHWSSGCWWISVVDAGVVVDARIAPDSAGTYCPKTRWTVEMLHDLATRCGDSVDEMVSLGFEGHTLEVTFNDLGVPETIEFDLSNGSDEEMSLTVSFAVE